VAVILVSAADKARAAGF